MSNEGHLAADNATFMSGTACVELQVESARTSLCRSRGLCRKHAYSVPCGNVGPPCGPHEDNGFTATDMPSERFVFANLR